MQPTCSLIVHTPAPDRPSGRDIYFGGNRVNQMSLKYFSRSNILGQGELHGVRSKLGGL